MHQTYHIKVSLLYYRLTLFEYLSYSEWASLPITIQIRFNKYVDKNTFFLSGNYIKSLSSFFLIKLCGSNICSATFQNFDRSGWQYVMAAEQENTWEEKGWLFRRLHLLLQATGEKKRMVIPLSNKLPGDISRLMPIRAADAWGDELSIKHTQFQGKATEQN